MRIMKKPVAHFVPASSRCAWSLCSKAQSVRNHRHEQFVQNQSRRARPQSQTRAGKLPRGSCHRGPPETEPSSTLAFKASYLKEWWWHSLGGTSPLGQWVWGHRIWSRNSSVPRAGSWGGRAGTSPCAHPRPLQVPTLGAHGAGGRRDPQPLGNCWHRGWFWGLGNPRVNLKTDPKAAACHPWSPPSRFWVRCTSLTPPHPFPWRLIPQVLLITASNELL